MIEKVVYGPVRKDHDDGHEFVLCTELSALREGADGIARRIATSRDSYQRANPVVRIARFVLREENL
jgi:hypothetical protein